MAKVHFPDGTTVEAVGIGDRRVDNADRDYGLYLDARWRPTWNADVGRMVRPASGQGMQVRRLETNRKALQGMVVTRVRP